MASAFAHFTHSTKICDDIDTVTCSICLEIYEKPSTISCGHTFCLNCLSAYTNLAEPQCPLCRKVFDPKKKEKASSVEKLIKSHHAVCKGCKKKYSLPKLKSHQQRCEGLPKVTKFEPVAPTSQKVPLDVPNRSTFQCPVCGLKNLTATDIVKHCNSEHDSSSCKVVCPICASMPWGNPGQKSSNFIQHLNLRHQFEYDTYVDFEQDDDTMLQAAIRASLEESRSNQG